MYIQMTEWEVRRDVRLAKDAATQVEILAQINDVPSEVIRRVLSGESWDEAVDDLKPKKRPKPPNPKWTMSELTCIKELRERGYSAKRIAEEMSRSESAIFGAVYSNPKVFAKRQYKSMSVKEIKDAEKYRGEGMSYGEIGTLLGRSGATIRAALKKAKTAHDAVTP